MPRDPMHERWLQQWEAARPALEEQHTRELREMTDEQAQAAADALLEIGASLPLDPARRTYSGLVEQQILFHRLPRETVT
jgi:hypothetical protein